MPIVYRINNSQEPGGLIVDAEGLKDGLESTGLFDDAFSVGDSIHIYVEEMTEEQLRALPDWDGF